MFFQCPGAHTQSLASLLIAQEILSAGGQLQAHQRDRMAEEAHCHTHRPQSVRTNTNTHTHTPARGILGQQRSVRAPLSYLFPHFWVPEQEQAETTGERGPMQHINRKEGCHMQVLKQQGEEDGGWGGGGGGQWISPSLLDPTAPPGRVFGVWSSIQRVGSSRLSGSLSGCFSLTPPPSQRN